jgi:hypothetical protein
MSSESRLRNRRPRRVIASNRLLFFAHSIGLKPEPGLPERLAEPFDADLHNALVNAHLVSIIGSGIVCELEDVNRQAAILADDIRDGTEGYHALAEQQFEPEQGFRANRSKSGDLCGNHSLANPYIGQRHCELYFSSIEATGYPGAPCGETQPAASLPEAFLARQPR